MLLEARTTTHESIETLHETDDSSLVAARDAEGSAVLLLVPRDTATGQRERERLDLLRGPGIPVPRGPADDRGEAIVLEGAAAARPLRAVTGLPDGVWRPALVHLLSALSHVHGAGIVHGRISRGHILADSSGEFWIYGWAGARAAVGRGPFQAGIDDVGTDVRDLGLAFMRYFGDVATDSEPLDEPAVQRAAVRVAMFDCELSRVLRRLVGADPHEGYENASEVLTDLGERDESLHEPFADLPFVGRGRIVRSILAHAERAGTLDAWLASFEIVGAPGSGKTRLLDETARAARDRGYVVMRAHGGAAHQPWGALGAFARQMLARLPADHELRTRRGVRILVGECPSPTGLETDLEYGDGASAALAELVTEAFRGTKGLLLLDDEDALSSHALQAWRALGRHVATASGSSHAASVLLVTTSARASADELGVPRERVELEDLARRHLAHVLGALLTERGKSAILASELHAIAGGRPADVVEHLRDALERKTVVPVGRRFHVEDPATAIRAGAGVDRFHRAVEAAGRDGAALAAVVAVAGRLRFPREVLGEIVDLSGHRLHAAADSAIRAGLIERDGATWRVRTRTLAERLRAALADDRLRSVHREILARLLDAEIPDWPAIAHHGRNAGDSRAADWTRSALNVLRTAGRHDEAATHFDDARTLLDPADLDIELRLLQVDTLLNAGRLGDAIHVADEVSRDPVATPRQRGTAILALARLHRYDQAWSRVLAIDLPVDCGDPLILAKIRLLRATSLIFVGCPILGDREARLAHAEIGDDTTSHAALHLEALEYRHDLAMFSVVNYSDALTATLDHMRACRARQRHLDVALDLVRVANIRRKTCQYALARAILIRASDYGHIHLGFNPLLSCWTNSTSTLIDADLALHRRGTTSAAAASIHAATTGGATLALNKRIQLAFRETLGASLPVSAANFVRNLVPSLQSVPIDDILFSVHHLTQLLLFIGHHTALCALHARLQLSQRVSPHIHLARIWHFVSECMIDRCQEISADLLAPNGLLSSLDPLMLTLAPHGDPAYATIEARRTCEAADAFVAMCIRRGVRQSLGWPAHWTDDYIASIMHTKGTDLSPGHDYLFSLMIDPTLPLRSPLWSALCAVAGSVRQPLPLAAEWRRTLAYARVHWSERRYVTGARLAREAQRQLRHLVTLNSPHDIDEFLAAAEGAIASLAIEFPPQRPALPTPGLPQVHVTDVTSTLANVWRDDMAIVAQLLHAVVLSPHLRELYAFSETLCGVDQRSLVWLHDSVNDVHVHPGDLHIALVSATTEPTWIRQCLPRIARVVATGCRTILLSTIPFPDLRSGTPDVRALLELLDGPLVNLQHVCSTRAHRVPLVRALLHRHRTPPPAIESAVELALAEYPWPGGLAEAERAAASFAASSPRLITLETLARVGWQYRAARVGSAVDMGVLEAVVSLLKSQPWLSSREIGCRLRRPSRTTVRILSESLRQGLIARRGRGRATRYALTAHDVNPDRA